jgi:hypothetical protein
MSGCLQFLKCLFNPSYLECCYVVGGCIYNQQYLELYFLWAHLTSALLTHWLTLQGVTKTTPHNSVSIPSSIPIKSSHRKPYKQGNFITQCNQFNIFWYHHLFTYFLLTYLLTPWNRGLLEELICFQLVKKFPTFYGTLRFITAFTSARHPSLS